MLSATQYDHAILPDAIVEMSDDEQREQRQLEDRIADEEAAAAIAQAETAAPDREAVEATCSDLCCGTCQYCVSYDRWYQAGMPKPA
jgi:hypothetical protein